MTRSSGLKHRRHLCLKPNASINMSRNSRISDFDAAGKHRRQRKPAQPRSTNRRINLRVFMSAKTKITAAKKTMAIICNIARGGLTLLFCRTVRLDFFHECRFILIFPFVHNYLALPACKTRSLKKPQPGDQLFPNLMARLREQAWEVMRFHHYSLRTEEAYWQWIKRFIFFHGKRHPRDPGTAEVSTFLSHLTTANDAAKANKWKSGLDEVSLYRFLEFRAENPSAHSALPRERTLVMRDSKCRSANGRVGVAAPPMRFIGEGK